MILYLSQGANPRIVQLFLQEKRLSLEIRHIDLAAGEHRSDAFLCKNALGQLPVLELDNGQCISQTTAICEYLEELHPTPPLIGATAEERAETRMWLRRLDFLITEPLVQAFKAGEGLPYYRALTHCIPHAAEDFRILVDRHLHWLAGEMESSVWLCGDRFSLADIQLFCILDFGRDRRLTSTPKTGQLTAWFERARQRLRDSLHQQAQ